MPSWHGVGHLKRKDLVFDKRYLTTLKFITREGKRKNWRRVGRVVQGMDIVDDIDQGDTINECGLIIRSSAGHTEND